MRSFAIQAQYLRLLLSHQPDFSRLPSHRVQSAQHTLPCLAGQWPAQADFALWERLERKASKPTVRQQLGRGI